MHWIGSEFLSEVCRFPWCTWHMSCNMLISDLDTNCHSSVSSLENVIIWFELLWCRQILLAVFMTMFIYSLPDDVYSEERGSLYISKKKTLREPEKRTRVSDARHLNLSIELSWMRETRHPFQRLPQVVLLSGYLDSSHHTVSNLHQT